MGDGAPPEALPDGRREGIRGGFRRLAALPVFRNRGHLWLAAAGVLAALAVRAPLLDFVSGDVRMWKGDWYAFIVSHGYFSAFEHEFSNHNVPYLYLMALVAAVWPGLGSLFTIKLIPVAFDFVLAFFVGKCVVVRYPQSKTIPVAAGVAALLAPTVVANGAQWGQTDAIYTSGLVACVYFLLRGRQAWAFLAYGFAFAFKLQAVFLLPLFLWLLVKRAVDWRYFLLSPTVWLVTLIPAWLHGRPFLDLATIYARQIGQDRNLVSQAANLYELMPWDWYVWRPWFLGFAAGVLLAVTLAIARTKAPITPERIVLLAAFSVLLVPYVTPNMHDRYFFPADLLCIVLAFFRPRLWYAPVVVILVSYNNYFQYLHNVELVPLPWMPAPMSVIVVVVGVFLFGRLDGRVPRVGVLALSLGALGAALALRFYLLDYESLWYDEAVSALASRGPFAEVVENLRRDTTMAILAPLLLSAVQSVEISTFTVRLVSVVSSSLTVAGLLFLLPAVGVGRRAALLAATAAALSWPAIVEAREVREYSVDALFALLLLAGLLWYLREGRRALLAAALFLGPLVQYGLAFFGVSVLVTAAVLRPRTSTPAPVAGASAIGAPPGPWPARLGVHLWDRLRARSDLIPAVAAFGLGAGLSWLLTAREQIARRGTVLEHLGGRYYGGELLDPTAVGDFLWTQTGELLTWHLPGSVVLAALAGLALLLFLSFRARTSAPSPNPSAPNPSAPDPAPTGRAVVLLLGLSLAVAAGAALLRLYPLGGMRQLLYLGPILFLAVGLVFSRLAGAVEARFGAGRGPVRADRFGRAGPVVFAVALGGTAVAGAADLLGTSPYGRRGNAESVLWTLDHRAAPGEFVHVTGVAAPPLRFHLEERGGEDAADRFHFGAEGCYGPVRPCVLEMVRAAVRRGSVTDRMWFVHTAGRGGAVRDEWKRWDERVAVEAVTEEEGDTDLFLLTGVAEAIAAREAERLEQYRALFDPAAPAGNDAGGTVRAAFALRHRDGFLILLPETVRVDGPGIPVLPRPLRGGRGRPAGERNGIRLRDPPLPLRRVPRGRAGRRWRRRVRGGRPAAGPETGEDPHRPMERQSRAGLAGYAAARSRPVPQRVPGHHRREMGEAKVRSRFDLFHDGTTLAYLREPCRPAEAEPRFLLHLYPSRFRAPGPLSTPPTPHTPGFENRDFDFPEFGMILDGKCLALVPLAGSGRGRLRTGQWRAGEEPLREASLDLERDLDRERYRRIREALAAGAWGPPAARSRFEIFLDGTALAYLREPCGEPEAAPRFFLHSWPRRRDDLPESRREYGFENRDFDFEAYGLVFDDACLAVVPLPGTPIGRLRTGQRSAGAGESWEVEIRGGGRPAGEKPVGERGAG